MNDRFLAPAPDAPSPLEAAHGRRRGDRGRGAGPTDRPVPHRVDDDRMAPHAPWAAPCARLNAPLRAGQRASGNRQAAAEIWAPIAASWSADGAGPGRPPLLGLAWALLYRTIACRQRGPEGESMSTIVTGQRGLGRPSNPAFRAQQIPFTSIPVIDFGPMRGTMRPARRAVGDAVTRGLHPEFGFFSYCGNHGVDSSVIDRTFEAATGSSISRWRPRRRYRSPTRRCCAVHRPSWPRTPIRTTKGDLHEGFDLALDLPETDPDVRSGALRLWTEPVARTGCRVSGTALERLPRGDAGPGRDRSSAPSRFALGSGGGLLSPPKRSAADGRTLRVLHYPSQDGENRRVPESGIGAHSDYECSPS